MPSPLDYSLLLFTGIKRPGGPYYVDNLTDIALTWQRSTRLQGGYWLGSFQIAESESDDDYIRSLYHNHLGSHIEERSGGMTTWEGMIYDMDLEDGVEGMLLTVSVAGYIFAANWRFVTSTTADDATGDLSVWVNNIVANHCADYLSVGRVSTNTLQYKRSLSHDIRAWDAIVDAAALGDASGNPWRAFVDNGRRFFYEPISTTPLYELRGGATRRRSFENMINYVGGTYIDNTGAKQTITPSSQAQSVNYFGRKEEMLYLDGVSQTVAEAHRDTYLKENAWPHSVTIGGADVQLYGVAGERNQVTPWQVRPGVMRDTSYPIAGSDPGGWLTDKRDFVCEEVICGANSGLTLGTWQFEESTIMAAQEEYKRAMERGRAAATAGDNDGPKKAAWQKYRKSIPGWDSMDANERWRHHQEYWKNWKGGG